MPFLPPNQQRQNTEGSGRGVEAVGVAVTYKTEYEKNVFKIITA